MVSRVGLLSVNNTRQAVGNDGRYKLTGGGERAGANNGEATMSRGWRARARAAVSEKCKRKGSATGADKFAIDNPINPLSRRPRARINR